jgi:hypothetical protein
MAAFLRWIVSVRSRHLYIRRGIGSRRGVHRNRRLATFMGDLAFRITRGYMATTECVANFCGMRKELMSDCSLLGRRLSVGF